MAGEESFGKSPEEREALTWGPYFPCQKGPVLNATDHFQVCCTLKVYESKVSRGSSGMGDTQQRLLTGP